MDERYYTEYTVAAVRGALSRRGLSALLSERARTCPLDTVDEDVFSEICAVASAEGIRLYDFKRTHRNLPRVSRVLGFLHGIQPTSLCDVGSGRGVFLLPFLDEFPGVPVTAVDLLPARCQMLSDLALGGVDRLGVMCADVCRAPLPASDVVSMLEVLEHIPDYRTAIRAAVAAARRYVVVSVPSHPDENPEHIHLLTREALTDAFCAAGVCRLRFEGVSGHLIMMASIGG